MSIYRIDFDKLTGDHGTKTFKSIRLTEYSQGLVNIDNWCEKAHTGYILEGEVMVEFENPSKLTIFNPGNGIWIPTGVKHRIRNVLTETARILTFNT